MRIWLLSTLPTHSGHLGFLIYWKPISLRPTNQILRWTLTISAPIPTKNRWWRQQVGHWLPLNRRVAHRINKPPARVFHFLLPTFNFHQHRVIQRIASVVAQLPAIKHTPEKAITLSRNITVPDSRRNLKGFSQFCQRRRHLGLLTGIRQPTLVRFLAEGKYWIWQGIASSS